MERLLAGLAIVVVVMFLVSLTTVVMAVHVLQRRNRVSPRVPTTAPLRWLWSPRLAARLHRRLTRTVTMARACSAGSTSELALGELVDGLATHACAVDAQLVVADRGPQPLRGRHLRELRAEVAELDDLAERILRLDRAWSGHESSLRGLAPVRERVEALESALADLHRIDRLPELPSRERPTG